MAESRIRAPRMYWILLEHMKKKNRGVWTNDDSESRLRPLMFGEISAIKLWYKYKHMFVCNKLSSTCRARELAVPYNERQPSYIHIHL